MAAIPDPSDQYPMPGDPGPSPTDTSDFAKLVTGWYQQLLGRSPSAAEIQAHRGNPSGLDGVYGVIARSPEAAAYAKAAAAAAAAAATAPAKPPGPTTYSLGGFDTGKLNDPAKYNDKYSHALKDQFLPAIGSFTPTTENLDLIVAAINANGGKATRTGKDTIDFGDGAGPIDVITDVGGPGAGWSFQNTTGNALWEKANPSAKVAPTTTANPSATSLYEPGGASPPASNVAPATAPVGASLLALATAGADPGGRGILQARQAKGPIAPISGPSLMDLIKQY